MWLSKRSAKMSLRPHDTKTHKQNACMAYTKSAGFMNHISISAKYSKENTRSGDADLPMMQQQLGLCSPLHLQLMPDLAGQFDLCLLLPVLRKFHVLCTCEVTKWCGHTAVFIVSTATIARNFLLQLQ